MGIKVKQKGSWKKTETFLVRAKKFDLMPVLERYGEIGVEALRTATPVRTGLTAASWYYSIVKTKEGYEIQWNNSNTVPGGTNVALLIQLGHGTGSGYYVQGRDYINPVIERVFNDLSLKLWRELNENG